MGTETVTPARGVPVQLVVSVVLAVLGFGWALLTGTMVIAFAQITYVLPPATAGGEATSHVHWHLPVLWALVLSVGAVGLAVFGVVLSLRARTRVASWWGRILPPIALVVATAAPFLALAVRGAGPTF